MEISIAEIEEPDVTPPRKRLRGEDSACTSSEGVACTSTPGDSEPEELASKRCVIWYFLTFVMPHRHIA